MPVSTAHGDFLFLGHGGVPARAATLWVVLENPAASAEAVRASLSAMGTVRAWRTDGPVAELKVRAASPVQRDQALQLAHRRERLGLVLQVTGGGDSDWHRASLADLGGVLDALERVLVAPGGPYAEAWRLPVGWRDAEVNTLVMKHLDGVRACMAKAVLRAVDRASSKRSRAVMLDLFLERLPAWVGRRFEVDVVVRHTLARLQQVSASSIEMPAAFHEALALRLGAGVARQVAPGAFDLGDASALAKAVDDGAWPTLRAAWRDGEPRQHAALLAQDDAHLARLGQHGFGTHLASAGAFRLAAGDFAGALKLFDAAVEGEVDPHACANPLYAVQDDNHHQGVMPERARRYLEACLPHGAKNPTIFLNAAFVFMELGEPERALEALQQAKAAGVRVSAHRNERLFAPLRTLPAFVALMR